MRLSASLPSSSQIIPYEIQPPSWSTPSRPADDGPQAVRFALRQCKQVLPVVRRMPALQHLLEDSVRIVRTLIGTFRVLVVHPSVHDDPARLMVTEEESVLLKELGAKPVLAVIAKGRALPIFGA